MAFKLSNPKQIKLKKEKLNSRDLVRSLKFAKLELSSKDKLNIHNAGMIPVLSSWITAVGRSGKDLYLMIGTNIWKYSGKGSLAKKIISSTSTGIAVWMHLYSKNLKGTKVGEMALEGVTDTPQRMIEPNKATITAAVRAIEKNTADINVLQGKDIVINKAKLHKARRSIVKKAVRLIK